MQDSLTFQCGHACRTHIISGGYQFGGTKFQGRIEEEHCFRMSVRNLVVVVEDSFVVATGSRVNISNFCLPEEERANILLHHNLQTNMGKCV